MALLGSVIIALIIICAVIYVAGLVKLPAPFEWVPTAIMVIVVAAVLIWIVTMLVGGGVPWIR